MTQELSQMLLGKKRIKLLVGEFGSGKTEIAINYAIKLKQYKENVAIVDMDLVKPYFHARGNRNLLEKNGVTVVAPEQSFDSINLPILPYNLTQILYNTDYHVVIDVGGGQSAIVVAQINQQLKENGYETMMVVNTSRPFTDSVEGICHIMRHIEQVSKLNIHSFISNTNLAEETAIEQIEAGVKTLEAVGKLLALPIKFVVAPESIYNQLHVRYPILPLKTYIQYPWREY
jgi:MinD-like ATPase involved in chromosome partitioning or flagellar assembly